MITLQLQTPKSSSCGQHCVAMVAGTEPAAAIAAVGKKSATSAKDLAKGLTALGFNPATRLERFILKKQLPTTCLLRINWVKGSHWVVYKDGLIYDPAYGVYKYSKQNFADLPNFKNCVSFLRIK